MTDAAVPSDSLADVMQHLQAQRAAASEHVPPSFLQSTGCLLMIAPIYSAFNEDCAADNHCHTQDTGVRGAAAACDDAAACMREFTCCVAALRSRAVKVWVFVPDDNIVTPDAHFPNNWISTYPSHAASSPSAVDIHSMRWPSRRVERRPAVVSSLRSPQPPLMLPLYASVNDFAKDEEAEGGVLEGTGSLVLDRVGRRAYVARSQRSEAAAAQTWARVHGWGLW